MTSVRRQGAQQKCLMLYINLYMKAENHQAQQQDNSPLQICNFCEETILSTYHENQTDIHHIRTRQTHEVLHILVT